MGKLRFVLGNIWFWVAMMVMCFLVQNLGFTSSDPSKGFDLGTLIIVSLACIICLFMFFFISHKENKMKWDWVLLPTFIILGIIFLLGIWIQQRETFVYPDGSGSAKAYVTIYEKVRASIILVVFLSFLYGGIFMASRTTVNARMNKVLLQTGIVTAYIALFYSLFAEAKTYVAMFKGTIGIDEIWIQSFFQNPNAFAGFLLLGFISCILANYYKPRLLLYISMLLFFFIMFFTKSSACIMICGLSLILYLFVEFVRSIVKRKVFRTVYLVCFFLIFIVGIILLFYGSSHNWKLFASIDKYLSFLVFRKDFGNLNNRLFVWKVAFEHIFSRKLHTLFGYGFMLSHNYLKVMSNYGVFKDFALTIETVHNGYLQILFEFGIVGFAFYIFGIVYFLYCLVRLLIEKRFHYAFIYFLAFSIVSLYNLVESTPFFYPGPKEMFYTFTIIMPVVMRSKNLWRKEDIDEFKAIPTEDRKTNYKTIARGLGVVLTSIIVMSGTMLVSPMTLSHDWMKTLWLLVLVAAVFFQLFLPYLIALYSKNSSGMMFLLHLTANILLIGVVIFGVSFSLYSLHLPKIIYYSVIAVLSLLLFTIDTIVYIFVKNGSFSEWGMTILESIFIIPHWAMLGAFTGGAVLLLSFGLFNRLNVFGYFIIAAIILFIYFGILYFVPTKRGKEMIEEANMQSIKRMQKAITYDETYYG